MTGDNDPDIRRERGDSSRGGPGRGGHVGGSGSDKNLDPDMGMPTGGADRNEGDQGSGAGDARVGPNARPDVKGDDAEEEAHEDAEGDSDVPLDDPDGHDRMPPSGGSGRDSGGGTNRHGSSRGSYRGGINRKTT